MKSSTGAIKACRLYRVDVAAAAAASDDAAVGTSPASARRVLWPDPRGLALCQ